MAAPGHEPAVKPKATDTISVVTGLRVTGGAARGRRLRAPKDIRPTQDMVKQAIFNMIGPKAVGARVLDLYAGSGGLGIEALSRGAAHATFVDRSPASIEALRRNLADLGYVNAASVIRADVPRWVEQHPDAVAEHDLILLDPPYADPHLDRVLEVLEAASAAGATVVVEHSSGRALPPLRRLRTSRQRRYGQTSVTIAQT